MIGTDKFSWPQLTQEEFESVAKPSLLKVFNEPCNYFAPFTSIMTSKMIAYCEIHPEEKFIDTVIDIASKFGEKGFYFSYVELVGQEIEYPGLGRIYNKPETWLVPFEAVQDYFNLYFSPGHVIYSSLGLWGIYIDEYDFLVIGGVSEFIDEILKKLPDLEKQYHEFIEDWKNNQLKLGARIDWIPKLLEHAYGSEKARQIMEEHFLNMKQ